MRIIEYLDKGADAFPERDAVIFGNQAWSFRAFQAFTARIAAGLIDEGLGPDSRVATWSPNHPGALACKYGVFRAGNIWVPVNSRNSLTENIALLNLLGVELLFVHSSLEADLPRIIAETPSLRKAICLDKQLPTAPSLDDWCADAPLDVAFHEKGSDGIVSMPTTSGTTGRAKAVRLTNSNWESMFANYQIVLKYDEPPVYLLAAPMTHAAGYFGATLMSSGATTVILPAPDPEAIMSAIDRYCVTTLFLPPTLVYMMLAHPNVRDYNYSSLRHMIYGGAPMSTEKLREATEVFGPVMAQHYGQTEAPVVISFMTPKNHSEALADPDRLGRLASAGREGPLVRVGILDDDGRVLPAGERGEIAVRGAMVTPGYWENPEADREVQTNGWHRTGDVGMKDQDGFLYIVDRKKDMIITGGFNVYPVEVEQVIWAHPSVQDCAVVGVPDDKWGEAVTAVIELKPGATIDENDLIASCKQQLGSVKAPKSVQVWSELPRSAVGKVLKREIRARFWEGRERAI